MRFDAFTRWVALISMLAGLMWTYQYTINAKGVCYSQPKGSTSKDIAHLLVDDLMLTFTEPLNELFLSNESIANMLQALSSAVIDVTLIWLTVTASLLRLTAQPLLSVFILMSLRYIAQWIAVFPCPEGYIWPPGKIFGWHVPSLFVDYHPANDFFFSGHAGVLCVAGIEYLTERQYLAAALHLCITLPYVSVLVVSFRVHRGIDIYTAILAAIASCHLSAKISPSVDRFLNGK